MTWRISLREDARVSRTSRQRFNEVISDLTAERVTHASSLGDYRDPWTQRLADLGIETVLGMETTSQANVLIRVGGAGGWGWNGDAVDAWLLQLWHSPLGRNKLAKLDRARAEQAHLVVCLDGWTPAGIGIPLGLSTRRERGAAHYRFPEARPRRPVSDLWIIPDTTTGEGLRWHHEQGWSILPAYQTGLPG